MKKIDCVDDITMESITLDDLREVFAEMDERVRRAHSVEEVVPILRETYFHLRVQALEDYITKEMKNKPNLDKLDEALMKVRLDESATKANTSVGYHDPDSASNAYNTSGMPTTPIPRPIEVPQEFRASCVDSEILPGEIIYLNLDGHWRPYRVMAKENDAIRLLGLFSIGEINETEPQYLRSLSSRYCDEWCWDIMKRGQNIENHLILSKMGALAFYIHIPDWKELQADCKAIAGDLSPSWYNDEDLSNIQVYTGLTGMTSILCGEDGEPHEFHYGDVEDAENCFPCEVRPSLTLRLGSLLYYYDPVCRADLAEFS